MLMKLWRIVADSRPLRRAVKSKNFIAVVTLGSLLLLSLNVTVFFNDHTPVRGHHTAPHSGRTLFPVTLIKSIPHSPTIPYRQNVSTNSGSETTTRISIHRVLTVSAHNSTSYDRNNGRIDPNLPAGLINIPPLEHHLTTAINLLDEGIPCDKIPGLLIGRMNLFRAPADVKKLTQRYPTMKEGRYTPTNCVPTERTALIIPFRDRHPHLRTLLPNLIPMLMRQGIDFTIFVVEQDLPTSFNKGVLFNAGYLEALKIAQFDCFILHDVDMLPLNDHNLYRCNDTYPVHFMAGVNKFRYRNGFFSIPSLLYPDLIGGVLGFTRHQFENVNGFSNLYFGWGAEDDDMMDRIRFRGMNITRKNSAVGLYDMIRHKRDKRWAVNKISTKLRALSKKRVELDGLNSVTYKLTSIKKEPLYIWINVFVNMTDIYATAPDNIREVIEFARLDDFLLRVKEGTAEELMDETL